MWVLFFFFKQKTAYEMRISDWSSDVCSSDLDDDTLDTDDESVDEEETPKPKKKNRFQERIDEVVGKHRETERKLEEALAENARLKNSQKQEDKPTQEVKPDDGPSPDAKNEDGSDKYPPGELDRKRVVSGKSGDVRVDFGGRRN